MFAMPWGIDDRTRGIAELPSGSGGIAFAYDILERVAAGLRAADAWMVVQPLGMGTQVFARRPGSLSAQLVGALAARPAGIYVGPSPGGHVDDGGLAKLAELLLAADHARRSSPIDAASGLASRSAIDGALARASACAARYGWSFTAVMLSTAGDASAEHRFDMLCRALLSAVRTGDEVGVAGTHEAIALLGHAGADVVRPFVGRVRAAMNALGAADVDLLVGAAGAPEETVDPHELWRLAADRLACERQACERQACERQAAAPGPVGTCFDERGEEGAGEEAVDALDWPQDWPENWPDVELDLRALRGVVAVHARGARQITLFVAGACEGLEESARRVLRVLARCGGERTFGHRAPEAHPDIEIMAIPVSGRGLEVVTAGREVGVDSGDGAPGAGARLSGVDLRERANRNGNGSGNGSGSSAAATSGTPARRAHARGLPPLLSATAPGESLSDEEAGATASAAPRARAHGEPTRAALVSTSFRADEGVSEVCLALGPARGTGRAAAGPLAGGAQATLEALEAVGTAVPFYLASCERVRAVPGEPVVVVLAPRAGGGASELLGLASGDDDLDAASRATLNALNRHISRLRAPTDA